MMLPLFPRKNFLYLLVGLLWLAACARPIPPTGGKKDTTPPRIDTLASTRNFQTRFTGRRIELKFDEWVVLQDQATQIVVSPPIFKRPEVNLKGKTVTVEFSEKEVLRPNTTYTINFGTAIKDLHEGNAAQDLRFVFSTGDFIDSLSVSGSVTDAFSAEPVENATILLYDIVTDSAIVQERPYYAGRTDKAGQYRISNVRAGTFKVVAIEDTDANLKWSGSQERLGFPDSLLHLNDSTRGTLNLKIFPQPGAQRRLSAKTNRYGQVQLNYSSLPDSLTVLTDTVGVRVLTERTVDSLLIWYDLPAPKDWRVYVAGDTIQVRGQAADEFRRSHQVAFEGDAPTQPGTGGKRRGQAGPAVSTAPTVLPPKTVSIPAAKAARFTFVTPVSAYDTSLWLLTVDTVRLTNFTVSPDSLAPRLLSLTTGWRPDKAYRLALLPGAVTDFFGAKNTDTLRATINILSEKQLGGLNLVLTKLRPGTAYILQLLNGTAVEETRRLTASAVQERLAFKNLAPIAYTARLIEDRNGNGRWETGDYFRHRQPERVFLRKLEALRANWDVEATMEATEVVDIKASKQGKQG